MGDEKTQRAALLSLDRQAVRLAAALSDGSLRDFSHEAKSTLSGNISVFAFNRDAAKELLWLRPDDDDGLDRIIKRVCEGINSVPEKMIQEPHEMIPVKGVFLTPMTTCNYAKTDRYLGERSNISFIELQHRAGETIEMFPSRRVSLGFEALRAQEAAEQQSVAR
ncbi:MAG: hypothetical protein J0M34_07220 [Alphaproteobacteria bacterium]|nr:hypothetical protein [Alphaproteobacteria bacterium]